MYYVGSAATSATYRNSYWDNKNAAIRLTGGLHVLAQTAQYGIQPIANRNKSLEASFLQIHQCSIGNTAGTLCAFNKLLGIENLYPSLFLAESVDSLMT
jgi:hypothetical protein